MKIIKSNANSSLEQIQNNRDFISSALDEIFLICREDDNFAKSRKKVESIDTEANNLQFKIDKQNNLLQQSKHIKNELLTKLSILESENENVKNTLLRKLGSTL